MGLLDRLENEATGTNAAVRKAAMYLMAFAVVNVGRELTYLIASVQHDGAPTIENYQAVFFSILSMFMGGLTRRLRVFSRRAWYSTIFIGAFLMLRIAREFWVFLNYVLSGVPNTDYQCLLLGFALFLLVAALYLLLSPEGRRPFFHYEPIPEGGELSSKL